MLEKIREGSQGMWAIVILGLVMLSFVFTGVGGYITASGEPAAAKVNGEDIPLTLLDRAYQNERARMENQFGEAISALFADEGYLREFRQGVLDRLIAEKLIEQKARDLGLRVSDSQIKEAIFGMPEFQVGGQFNNDRYLAILRQAGFQPNSFRDYLRAEMTRDQLARALNASEFNLPSETQEAIALQSQTRDVRFVNVPASDFAEQVEVTDDELQAYYQTNIDRYDTQERVSVAYVTLSVDDLLPTVDASDDELNEYYQFNINSYRTDEERRASHILVEFGDDESAAEATAQALLERIQGGEDFATVAQNESADTFSAENGGDLDWFTRGVMDPAFEEAAFGLAQAGDLSNVVKSEFGFHIIKLTDVKPEQIQAFEDVIEDIRTAVLRENATEEFYNIQQRMAELAFEVPDSLDEVAATANKDIVVTELFTRAQAPAPVNAPNTLAAAFSDELLFEGVNSDLIELSGEEVIVLRTATHEPQRTKSFDEVSTEIETALRAEKAQNAAFDWASSLLSQVNEGTDIQPQLDEKSLIWQTQENVSRSGAGLDRNVAEELFKLSPESGSDYAVAKTGSDVSLLQLTKVTDADAPEDAQVVALQQRFAAMRGQAVYNSLIESMRARAEIEIIALQ